MIFHWSRLSYSIAGGFCGVGGLLSTLNPCPSCTLSSCRRSALCQMVRCVVVGAHDPGRTPSDCRGQGKVVIRMPLAQVHLLVVGTSSIKARGHHS